MIKVNLHGGGQLPNDLQSLALQQERMMQMLKVRRYFPGSVLNSFVDLGPKVVNNLRPFMHPVEVRTILGETPPTVLLLGEDHFHRRAKVFATGLLEQLRTAGYTHIGVEWLRSDLSTLVRDYNVNGSHAAELKRLLTDPQEVGFMASAGEENFEFIETAHRLGFTIVPLNITKTMQDIDRQLFGEGDITYRDLWMAKMAKLGLFEPSRLAHNRPPKMVAMVGAGHIDQNLSLPNVLRGEYGIDSASVFYATEGSEVEQPMMVEFTRETAKNIPIFTPITGLWMPGHNPWPANWFVFVP